MTMAVLFVSTCLTVFTHATKIAAEAYTGPLGVLAASE